MAGLWLAFRALAWRRGSAFAIFVVATIAVVAAAIGPMYLASAKQSSLRATLASAPAHERDVQAYVSWDASLACQVCGGRVQLDAPEHYLSNYLPQKPWLSAPVISVTVRASVSKPSGPAAYTLLGSRDAVCAHLRIVAGSCPDRAFRVLVSTRSAAQAGVHVGSTLTLQVSTSLGGPTDFTVAGLYLPPADVSGQYWWGQSELFDFEPPVSSPRATLDPSFAPSTPLLDEVFTPVETMTRIATETTLSVRGDMAILPGRISRADLPVVRATLARLGHDAPSKAHFRAVTVVPALLDRAERESTVTSVPITIVSVDLLLLALFVLYQVVRSSTQARATEVAISKLRGLSPLHTLRFALTLPVLLLALAVPVGVLAAWQVDQAVVSLRFAPGTASSLTLSAWGAALVAFGGGLLACALAVRPVLMTRLTEQLRRTEDMRANARNSLIGDAVALALALAGLTTLAFNGVFTADKVNTIALAAPAFVCVAVAIVGVRLLPLLLQLVLRVTRESRHVGAFLGVRQLVRRSATLRLVVLLGVAFGLTTFAVYGWNVEQANRTVWAGAKVGAAEVLTVRPPFGSDFQKIVRDADATGASAMAVAVVPLKKGVGMLAVDSSRLASVADWRPTFSATPLAQAARALHPAVADTIFLKGESAKVDLSLKNSPQPKQSEWLAMQVQLPTNNVVDVDFIDVKSGATALKSGRHTYEAALPPECARVGCRLAGFDVRWTPATQFAGIGRANTLEIFGLYVDRAGDGVWARVSDNIGVDHAWRNDDDPRDGGPLIAGKDRLTLVFDDIFSGVFGGAAHAGIVPADTPDELPAIVSGHEYSSAGGGRGRPITVPGLDAGDVSLKPVAFANTLPQFLRAGAIVDYTNALRHQSTFTTTGDTPVIYQVWLAPSAPKAAILQNLAASGVQIVDTRSAAEMRKQLSRDGSALAFDALLFAAVAAALLATGAAVVTVFLVARRRTFELAAMRAMGVPRRALLRGCVFEQWLLLSLGAALGIAGGLLAAHFSLPTVPEFVDQKSGPPLEFALPRLALGIFVAAIAVLVAALGQAAAWALLRGAAPARLRTVQE